MALHGNVSVNGRIVGHWSAQRTSARRDEVNVYDCEVVTYGTETLAAGRETFQLEHRYDDGPMALAAKVLGHATAPVAVYVAIEPGTAEVSRRILNETAHRFGAGGKR